MQTALRLDPGHLAPPLPRLHVPDDEPAPGPAVDQEFVLRFYKDGTFQIEGYTAGTRDPRPLDVTDRPAVALIRATANWLIVFAHRMSRLTGRGL